MKEIKGIKSIKESFKTKQVKYGGYAALLTLAVLVGLVILNLMAGQFSPQIDFTQNRLFSLSEQTINLLNTIKTPVKFYGLWRQGDEDSNLMNVINLYLSKSRNISLEVIDPDRNPGFVMRYDREKQGISRGSLIVEGEKAFKIIAPREMYDFTMSQSGGASITAIAIERRITSALLFTVTGDTPVVYEISGHSEIPLSMLNMAETLERENYSLKTINLLLSAIPDDASALVINTPQKDLTGPEAEKLLDYLGKGGRLLVIANYLIQELPNLNEVLASYGLRYDYGIVHETDPSYHIYDARTVWPDMQNHEITAPLADKTRTPVILIEAMPLSILETRRRTVEVKPLMATSSSAFLRLDLENNSDNKTSSDVSGPFMLGAAAVDPQHINNNEAQARIVAIGSGAFLSLAAQGIDGNRDFFMNGITWLQDRPENITIRARSLYLLPLRLNLVQIIIFGALFILVVPASFLITGFVIWLKRRHL